MEEYTKVQSADQTQLDIGDDDFMSLMGEDGASKDDVKCPDNEIGAKIRKLFIDEEKDTSAYTPLQSRKNKFANTSTDVIILAAMGEECAIEGKEAPRGA